MEELEQVTVDVVSDPDLKSIPDATKRQLLMERRDNLARQLLDAALNRQALDGQVGFTEDQLSEQAKVLDNQVASLRNVLRMHISLLELLGKDDKKAPKAG